MAGSTLTGTPVSDVILKSVCKSKVVLLHAMKALGREEV
jgi:hypothetical protein